MNGMQDMQPSAAHQAFQQLADAATTFTQAWAAAREATIRLEGQLGKPHLGAAFMDNYLPLAVPTREDADQIGPRLMAARDAGVASVDDYTTTNAQDAANIDKAVSGLAEAE
ncbi:hypothetical protein [Thermocrispum municipale]|uniref:hypothetical protein n=1 Tax=Thermocrispum municipale TaxID=37926 RepID=UPI0003F7BB33|nr:hypothetical protein [Thermocrispum municipale]